MVTFSTNCKKVIFWCLLWFVVTATIASGQFFDEYQFRRSVDKALASVATILDNTRNPRLAEDEDHTYNDKYALAEFLTNTAIAAHMNSLEKLGLSSEIFVSVWNWVHENQRTVTLRFQAEDSCIFEKEKDVKIVTHESEREVEITTDSAGGTWFGGEGEKSKTENQKTRVSTTVKEFHWKVTLGTRLTLLYGNDPGNSIELQKRNSSTSIITSGGLARDAGASKNKKPPPPIPEKTIHEPIDIDLTWLIQMISKEKVSHFSIDRFSSEANKTCRTPRRNDDIDKAIRFANQLQSWTQRVMNHFEFQVENRILRRHQPGEIMADEMESKDETLTRPSQELATNLFYPILPVMEKSSLLSAKDTEALLDEQSRRIDEALDQLSKMFPPKQNADTLLSSMEAMMILLSQHIQLTCLRYVESVSYIEQMLRKQLVQAIGKEITGTDFNDFMRFHNEKMFGSTYGPKLFSYAIRRPEHYPDGVVAIETATGGTYGRPIETMVRHVSNVSDPVFIPISAATSVEIRGDRYLHGWMLHIFENFQFAKESYQLSARAHQFSSFLVIIGKMAGPNKFSPESAIILQNKDEILIPLITEVLPSAKEFKDAIASLSPEQQAFARAFRSMQLESSVFGVCIIQLKPQLEKLLGLPKGALTKEIQLTQDLMSLFIEYQIPSDLLSFDGAPDSNVSMKLQDVKNNVGAVLEVIEKAKDSQLRDEKNKADMQENMYGTGAASASGTTTTASSVPSASPNSSPTISATSVNAERRAAKVDVAGRARPRERSLSASMDKTESRAGDDLKMFATQEGSSGKYSEGSEPRSDRNVKQKTTQGQPKDTATSRTDFTLIPRILDAKLEVFDTDGSLRSTVVKAGPNWERARQRNLLTTTERDHLGSYSIEAEKKKAFDLLDALSRSGSLPIETSELHVVVPVSHCFAKNIMATVIEDNINPIEKAEKSALLVASTIYGETTNNLIGDKTTLERLTKSFPAIFDRSKQE